MPVIGDIKTIIRCDPVVKCYCNEVKTDVSRDI